jgi:hypothetical protein
VVDISLPDSGRLGRSDGKARQVRIHSTTRTDTAIAALLVNGVASATSVQEVGVAASTGVIARHLQQADSQV